MTDETQALPALERGKVYQSKGPGDEQIALMNWDTWVDMNTGIESLRQALSNQTRLLKEKEADYGAAMVRLADVTTRLENLRAVRREEKRAEIEPYFNNSQG